MAATDPNAMFNDGKAYEQLMGRWSQRVGTIFLDWIGATKGLSWLDVGCGNGAFTEVLIGRCAPRQVVAVDPSEGQLSFARTREATRLAQFKLADAQALPFPDNSFDAASMALVIAFVPEPIKAAAEMRRVVKPGGVVATYMWDMPKNGAPLWPMYSAMDAMGLRRNLPPSGAVSALEPMRALWSDAGLADVEAREIRITVSHPSFEAFWNANAVPQGPQGQAIAGLSPENREELKSRVRQVLPIAADGSIAYEAFANAVKGRVPQ